MIVMLITQSRRRLLDAIVARTTDLQREVEKRQRDCNSLRHYRLRRQ